MSCHRARKALDRGVARDAAARDRLETHARGCADCRAELDWRAALAAALAAPAPASDPLFVASTLARVRAARDAAPQDAFAESLFAVGRRWAPRLALAAVALAAIAAWAGGGVAAAQGNQDVLSGLAKVERADGPTDVPLLDGLFDATSNEDAGKTGREGA